MSSLWAYDADLAEKIEEQEHKVGGKGVCCVTALLPAACGGAAQSLPRPPEQLDRHWLYFLQWCRKPSMPWPICCCCRATPPACNPLLCTAAPARARLAPRPARFLDAGRGVWRHW